MLAKVVIKKRREWDKQLGAVLLAYTESSTLLINRNVADLPLVCSRPSATHSPGFSGAHKQISDSGD